MARSAKLSNAPAQVTVHQIAHRFCCDTCSPMNGTKTAQNAVMSQFLKERATGILTAVMSTRAAVC